MPRYARANAPWARAGHGAHASVPDMVGMPATSMLSLTYVGTPAKEGVRGISARLATRVVEGLVRQSVQSRVDRLGARDRGLDELLGRHVTGAEALDQPDRVVVSQGVVTEGMHVARRSSRKRLIGSHARDSKSVPPRTEQTG